MFMTSSLRNSIGLSKVAKEKGAKLERKNSPMMQLETTPNQFY